nr:MAG TPA: hypothetical protein [Caudoviricetes sp.]
MPIANEGKTGRYPWGEVNAEPVKTCCPEEVTPMIERLQMLGRQMEMIACGLDNLNTRLFIGCENAKNFEYDRGTGSADDAVNNIARLADISLKILEDIHTKL